MSGVGCAPTNGEFLVGPSSIENYMTNKPALLVFYGLIIASVTVWVSLAVTML